jgi:hypothetical protein
MARQALVSVRSAPIAALTPRRIVPGFEQCPPMRMRNVISARSIWKCFNPEEWREDQSKNLSGNDNLLFILQLEKLLELAYETAEIIRCAFLNKFLETRPSDRIWMVCIISDR